MSSLDGDSGVVIGTLFETGSEQHGPRTRLEPAVSARIVDSGGQELISHHWGSYVAFIQDPGARLTHVLRDPCGATPCLRMHVDGVDVLCSFVDDIVGLSG